MPQSEIEPLEGEHRPPVDGWNSYSRTTGGGILDMGSDYAAALVRALGAAADNTIAVTNPDGMPLAQAAAILDELRQAITPLAWDSEQFTHTKDWVVVDREKYAGLLESANVDLEQIDRKIVDLETRNENLTVNLDEANRQLAEARDSYDVAAVANNEWAARAMKAEEEVRSLRDEMAEMAAVVETVETKQEANAVRLAAAPEDEWTGAEVMSIPSADLATGAMIDGMIARLGDIEVRHQALNLQKAAIERSLLRALIAERTEGQ